MESEPERQGRAEDARHLQVLREIWSAQGQSASDIEAAPSNAKVCKRMKDIGFGAMAGDGDTDSTDVPVDEDLRSAWRARLEREGKLVPGAGSLRDLVRQRTGEPGDSG